MSDNDNKLAGLVQRLRQTCEGQDPDKLAAADHIEHMAALIEDMQKQVRKANRLLYNYEVLRHDNKRYIKAIQQYADEAHALKQKAATVDSEREANSILTEELEALKQQFEILQKRS